MVRSVNIQYAIHRSKEVHLNFLLFDIRLCNTDQDYCLNSLLSGWYPRDPKIVLQKSEHGKSFYRRASDDDGGISVDDEFANDLIWR